MSLLMPGVRFVPLRLSGAIGYANARFVCRQCLGKRQPRILQSLRQSRRHATTTSTSSISKKRPVLSLAFFSTTNANAAMSTAAHAATQTASQVSKRPFPATSSKSVAYWLLGSAASVFGIVVFGGLTRLTESGYALTSYINTWGSSLLT
jgi:heme a synthase